jgi:hypothetical protein
MAVFKSVASFNVIVIHRRFGGGYNLRQEFVRNLKKYSVVMGSKREHFFLCTPLSLHPAPPPACSNTTLFLVTLSPSKFLVTHICRHTAATLEIVLYVAGYKVYLTFWKLSKWTVLCLAANGKIKNHRSPSGVQMRLCKLQT